MFITFFIFLIFMAKSNMGFKESLTRAQNSNGVLLQDINVDYVRMLDYLDSGTNLLERGLPLVDDIKKKLVLIHKKIIIADDLYKKRTKLVHTITAISETNPIAAIKGIDDLFEMDSEISMLVLKMNKDLYAHGSDKISSVYSNYSLKINELDHVNQIDVALQNNVLHIFENVVNYFSNTNNYLTWKNSILPNIKKKI